MYKGFDLKQGIDIAWSRILQDANGLANDQMTAIVGELEKGIDLDHPNIIKCYRAWHDTRGQCINFITEFFTSGNLRDFRQKHKHLEVSFFMLHLIERPMNIKLSLTRLHPDLRLQVKEAAEKWKHIERKRLNG